MKFNQNKKPSFKQKGVSLILMVFLLGLLITGYVIRSFDLASLNSLHDTNSTKILAEAKSALIGYSLSRIGAGERPGNMPYPDYFDTPETPFDFDGTTDGCMDSTKPQGLPLIINGANMRCLGRLPWKTIGMTIVNPTQNDVLGEMPWYAVSANLVESTCLNSLNPNLLTMTYAGYICGGSTLPHPWLTVRDSKGNILSNRVAVVLIKPAAVINGQTRPLAPLNDKTNYLDTVTVAAGCTAPCTPGTYSNADADNDFIMASGVSGSIVDSNDRILYITIDELIDALVKRAAGEAKIVLKGYKTANGSFPYAAPLGSTGNNFIYSGTSNSGMLPIDGTDTCTCGSSSSCTCSYSLVSSVAHTRTSGGSYSSQTLGCSFSGRTCTCSGRGTCTNGSRTFDCDVTGACTFSGSGGTTSFTYMPKVKHGNISSASGNCSLLGANVVCNDIGSFNVGLNVPVWFKSNQWQEYFYYRWSSPANLQVGSQTGVEALIVGAGAPIFNAPYASKGSAQTRPSGLIDDYLDSSENTNGDPFFDGTNVPQTTSYNDKSFIVSP